MAIDKTDLDSRLFEGFADTSRRSYIYLLCTYRFAPSIIQNCCFVWDNSSHLLLRKRLPYFVGSSHTKLLFCSMAAIAFGNSNAAIQVIEPTGRGKLLPIRGHQKKIKCFLRKTIDITRVSMIQ